MKTVHSLFVGCFSILSVCFFISSAHAAQLSSFVSVSGTKFILNGKEFIPVGINHHDEASLWMASNTQPWTDVTLEDWRAFRRLGFNSVRLSVKADYFATSSGFAWLDRELQWAKNQGIRVILDMHIPSGGVQQDYQPNAMNQRFWDDPALQDQLVNVWGRIADRYVSSTTIWAYDLFNEPTLRDVGRVTQVFQRIRDRIRVHDAHHVLLFQPIQLYVDGKEIFVYPNVPDVQRAFSIHFYRPYAFTVQGVPWGINGADVIDRYPATSTKEGAWNAQRIEEALNDLGFRAANEANVPAVIGEFGVVFHDRLQGQYFWIEDVMKAAKRVGIGWEYWVYKTRNLNGSVGLMDGQGMARKVILRLLSDEARLRQ